MLVGSPSEQAVMDSARKSKRRVVRGKVVVIKIRSGTIEIAARRRLTRPCVLLVNEHPGCQAVGCSFFVCRS